MEEIISAVKRVTNIVGEIATASHEQSCGIEQVNEAVTHMDQMTQQNAALVGDSAGSAEFLEAQAKLLSDALSIFQTGKGQAKPERASRRKRLPAKGGKQTVAATTDEDVAATGAYGA